MSGLRLQVDEIRMVNLRCHEQFSCHFESGINLLTGQNGSGKTTILEAVYMMAYGRSFRQARDPQLVRWGERDFRIGSTWHRYGPLHVQVAGKPGRTEITLQGRKVSQRRELGDTLPVVADAPQAARVIDAVPNKRRRWLDQFVMACEPAMMHHYQAYLRAMMQRSRLLRRRTKGDELAVWEAQMVQHGRPVITLRRRVLDALNGVLHQDRELTESPLQLCLRATAPEDDGAWQQDLAERRGKDARLGRLTIGPHCDRPDILFREREIRSAGSRGQQKLAAMALRLAECAVRYQYRQIYPVLLLDDCLEALDESRQQRLLARLNEYPGQVLATAPNGISTPSQLQINLQQIEGDNGAPAGGQNQRMERAA